MSFSEWGRLLGELAEGPEWVAERLDRHGAARFGEPPAPRAWSALEVLCHLRDADRDVYLPRLERMLAESQPFIADVSMRDWDAARAYRDQDARAALADWRAARRALLSRLAPLGRADWGRVGIHSVHGPYPLGDMVRYWVEHDLVHRRQIAAALEGRA